MDFDDNSHSQTKPADPFVKVGQAGDVPVGSVKRFAIDNRAIALANIDGKFYAFEDRCLHWGVRLSDGYLEGQSVLCRAHGWKHNVVKGEVAASQPPGDEGRRVITFATKVQDGSIWVSTTANRINRPD